MDDHFKDWKVLSPMVTLGCLHDLGHGTWQSHRKDPSMSMVRTSSGGAEQEWCAKGNHIPSGNIGVFQPLSASVYVNLPEGICCPQKIHPKSPCGFPQQKTGSSERPWTGGEPQWPQKNLGETGEEKQNWWYLEPRWLFKCLCHMMQYVY